VIGDSFGATLALAQGHRQERFAYSAVFIRDSELVILSHPAFALLVKRNPTVAVAFSQSFASGKINTISAAPSRTNYVTIAVLPISSFPRDDKPAPDQALHRSSQQTGGSGSKGHIRPPVSATASPVMMSLPSPGAAVSTYESFMRRLETALAQQGPTLRVNSRRLEHKFGAGVKEKLGNSIIQNKVLMWLTQQEEDLRFILLEVDPLENSPDAATVTDWTRCCIGQADVVLLTAMAGEKELVSRMEHDMVWTTLSPKVDRGRSHGSRFSDLGLMAGLQSSNSVGSFDSHGEDTSGDSDDSDGEESEGPSLGCHGRKQGTDIVGKHRHLVLLHPESSAGPLGLFAFSTSFLLCHHSFQVTLASPPRWLTLPVVIVPTRSSSRSLFTLLLASNSHSSRLLRDCSLARRPAWPPLPPPCPALRRGSRAPSPLPGWICCRSGARRWWLAGLVPPGRPEGVGRGGGACRLCRWREPRGVHGRTVRPAHQFKGNGA
jgi:hypothetical protein